MAGGGVWGGDVDRIDDVEVKEMFEERKEYNNSRFLVPVKSFSPDWLTGVTLQGFFYRALRL